MLGSLTPAHVRAQGLEGVLAPGKVVRSHAKAEAECDSCHRKFDRAAQDQLCGECHKDVRADVRARTGFHGRQKPQPCRSCHTDHKGRDADIVGLDVQRFDHTQTDYPLAGKHLRVECKSCHPTGRKWRDAPSDCLACHQKDDVHKRALGTNCKSCHGDADWKKTSFDHAKTRFELSFKHEGLKCSACHEDQRYQNAPRQCIGCHRKDDEQVIQGRRGHQGQYGEKCESCHNAKGWKPSTFQHERDAHYALKGRHAKAECKSCHTAPLYKQKLATDCVSCHRRDDRHEGTLGKDCGSCHTERGWRESSRVDHDKTLFPLLGKHTQARCEACHQSTVFKDAPRECVACHLKDDRHARNLGQACQQCHYEKDWKTTQGRFDHDKTRFALRNAHAAPRTACKACHRSLSEMRGTERDCVACHAKDDKHRGQLGRQCEQCHGDADWKRDVRVDHARSRFPLTGRHQIVACKECHGTPLYKDTPSDCHACHREADTHKRTLGTQCATCHNTRAWTLWTFDHDAATRYRLEAGHRRVGCLSCHRQPAPAGKPIAPLGTACIECHRKDDVHDGGFGSRCEQCHSAEHWKKLSPRLFKTGSATAQRGRLS